MNKNNIKYFKYKNIYNFQKFLNECGYALNDILYFSVANTQQYRGNVLQTYAFHFNDGECEYFKIVYFKDFNEYNQSRLGFNGDKLLE